MEPHYDYTEPRRARRISARPGVLAAAAGAIALASFAAGAAIDRQSASAALSLPTPAAASPVGAALPGTGFADLVDRVRPAAISVQAMVEVPSPVANRLFRNRQAPVSVAEGSAFFISADGYAVTNHHVVDGARVVQVTTEDGAVYRGDVIGTDPATDLALIKVDAPGPVAHVAFADGEPRVGDWVVAVGSPFGLGHTVTAGIVSAVDRELGRNGVGYIQIDAPINQGNSGGPTFDLAGNVVGINSMIFSPNGGSVGVGFDIPASTAKSVIAGMMGGGLIDRLF